MSQAFDVVVVGGGAAGLMCALTAGQRGRRVLLLEVANKFGKKILMSGGGRCNFTNLDVQPEHFICANPHFVKSALSQYTQWDFIQLVEQHGITYEEKKHGQLFCKNSAKDILLMLLAECQKGKIRALANCQINKIDYQNGYQLQSNLGSFSAESLVLATGGLSIPTLGGATGFAYDYAEKKGVNLTTREASLVPMTLTGAWHDLARALSGVSLPVFASVDNNCFAENLLFTHRGISGPAILQLSNYWHLGQPISIDFLPFESVQKLLSEAKQKQPNAKLANLLNPLMPRSVVEQLLMLWCPELIDKPLQEIKQQHLLELALQLNQCQLTPSGTEGYRTAEVTRGGVDVSAVSSKTMRLNVPSENCYLIGEALDVTGHLGGYNFQWAWSSGFVAGVNA